MQKVKTTELDIECDARRSAEHCQRESAVEKADQGVGKRKSSSKWNKWISGGCSNFFRWIPSEVRKEQRSRYIACRTVLWNAEKCEFAVSGDLRSHCAFRLQHPVHRCCNREAIQKYGIVQIMNKHPGKRCHDNADVKVSDQGWKRNCFIIGAERQNITQWKNWNSWFGGISWVTGAITGSARPSAESLLL